MTRDRVCNLKPGWEFLLYGSWRTVTEVNRTKVKFRAYKNKFSIGTLGAKSQQIVEVKKR